MKKQAGFTLIELTFVIAGIAVLSALAVPGYDLFLRRTRLSEARAALEGMVHAENAWHRDHGTFVACAPSSDAIPKGTTSHFDASRAGWKEIGIALDGEVRYQYEIALEGKTFRAIARGDLDGDGKPSTIEIRGDDFSIQATDELE